MEKNSANHRNKQHKCTGPDFKYTNVWCNKKKKQLAKTRMDRKIKKERQRNAGEQLEWESSGWYPVSLSVSGCFLWMLLRSAVTHLFWWRLRSVNWEVGGYPTPCTLWILCILATTRTLQNPCASLSLRRRASDGVQDWFAGAEVWLAAQGTPTLSEAGVSLPPACWHLHYPCFHGSGRSPHMAQVGGSACDTITLPVG